MIEIIAGIVSHAQLFHYAPRTKIRRNSEANDLCEPHHFKPMASNRSRSFGRKTHAPMGGVETPPDFYAWSKDGGKARHREPRVPDKFAAPAKFRCPQAEAVFHKVRFDAVDQGIALRPRQQGGKELHHRGIAIHPGERFAIGGAPAPEQQSFSLDHSRIMTTLPRACPVST